MFCSREEIQKLKLETSFWKHSKKITSFLSIEETEKCFTEKQLASLFQENYVPGMTKEEFFSTVDLSEGPYSRIYGGWNSLLNNFGFGGYSNKCKGMTKSDVILIAYDWLKENSFSVSKWDKDISLPSQRILYNFFGSIPNFLKYMKGLSEEDILGIREASQEKKEVIKDSSIITSIKEVDYKGSATYDLEVEKNENFLIGSVLSHNCGAQALVYAEDVLIDDVVRIAWNVSQSRTPIFGYASQYFNALAAGPIIVQGAFWIGFKEAGYMPAILNFISQRRSPDEPFYASPAQLPESGRTFGTSLVQSARVWEGEVEGGETRRAGRVTRAGVERFIRAQDTDPTSLDTSREMRTLTSSLGAMSDQNFEDMAERFEDALWYGGQRPQEGRRESMSGNWAGGSNDSEDVEARFLAVRRADQYPPFDLLITFGDMNTPAANHTLHRITDVTILDTEFGGVENTGDPIFVKYSFLARNVM